MRRLHFMRIIFKNKDGMKLSKSSDDAVGITMAYSPENIEYAKQEAETVTENKRQ